jgi:lipoprotein-anchoring transpeptidase ErfK/SrfK
MHNGVVNEGEVRTDGDPDPVEPHPRARRRLLVGAVLAALVSLSWVGVTALRTHSQPRGDAAATRISSPRTGKTDAVTPTTIIAQTTSDQVNLIATLPGDVQGYASPNGPSTGIVPGSWYGVVSTLPVIADTPGWYEVRLAQRPNESTAWIHTAGVALTSTPYRIVVNLTTMQLTLYDQGNPVLDAPAGIGAPDDPTPTGEYFVAFFAQAPSPGYGPFVLVTSAHSDAISDWEGSGDAIIAIHGPLGDDAEIGTTGAAISHGCIRLHDSDLAQLRDVPAGSPIDIVS